LNKCT